MDRRSTKAPYLHHIIPQILSNDMHECESSVLPALLYTIHPIVHPADAVLNAVLTLTVPTPDKQCSGLEPGSCVVDNAAGLDE